MYTQVEKPKENKSRALAYSFVQNKSVVKQDFEFVNNRPEAIAQRKLEEIAHNNPQVKQVTQLQGLADNHAVQQQQSIQTKELDKNLSGDVIQCQLKIDTANPDYVSRVGAHLKELVGDTGVIVVNRKTGIVRFLKKRRGAKEVAPTPGHRLIRSLVEHDHTTIIKEAQGEDALSSQPILPNNTFIGKGIDWFKSFQYMRKRGYLTHEARAFVNGSTPGLGVGTIVHYDASLSDKGREGVVRLRDGGTRREASPQSISLGHELIHSDHFHRGLGAYDEKGTPILSSRQHTYSDFSRGETTNLEEINTVGLNPLPPEHDFHDHITENGLSRGQTYQSELKDRDHEARKITEQDLRRQMKLLPRAGYER